MAVPTSSTKNRGPIVNPALCRCCRSIKKCRLLSSEYEWSGNKEVYSDMFVDCFGLLFSHLDGDTKDSCICATCVVRLRDACAFKQQVLQCEQAFMDAKLESKEESIPKIEVKVKMEPHCESDSDAPLMDTATDADGSADYTDSELDAKMEMERTKPSRKEIVINTSIAKRTRSGKQREAKQIIGRMQQIQVQLDKMLDKTEPPPKKPKPSPKKKNEEPDHDNMIYRNAVTIVHNSYICPFHNRISNYYCYYCRDQFTNPMELREHTLTHPVELFVSSMENNKIPKMDITRIDCRLCDQKIDDLPTFKTHITVVHGKILYPVSNEFLSFRLSLDNVMCTECNSTFPYFDMAKKHMNEHFGTFICDQCGACFLEQNSLRTHIKSHSKVEANFPCEICGKNLKSKYSRYLHVATVHEKKATVNCYKCDDSFLSYALRNRHLIEVHGDKRTFPCKLCDKVYNRRKTLMEHNRRNHLKVYRHQCDLCDQRFYLPSRLKEHMATHTGERNFRCEFCDKSYPRLQSLQEHIRSHNNERRFKCDICNSAFTQNGSLKNHMKSHHQGFDMDSGFN